MATPEIKSRKQLIRIWFEFYKLCLDDSRLRGNIKKSRSYYEPWGECRGVKFDDWWRDHKSLFGSTRVEEALEVSRHPSVLTLSVPLNQPVSKTLPEVKKLIEKTQKDRLRERGIDPKGWKSLASGCGLYELSMGEARGRVLNEILVVYSIWKSLGEPPINSEFCQSVIDTLKGRPRAKWIPHIVAATPIADSRGRLQFSQDQLRQLRRYVKRGEELCSSVSLGVFPGPSRLASM
jgi:hypothetical protein